MSSKVKLKRWNQDYIITLNYNFEQDLSNINMSWISKHTMCLLAAASFRPVQVDVFFLLPADPLEHNVAERSGRSRPPWRQRWHGCHPDERTPRSRHVTPHPSPAREQQRVGSSGSKTRLTETQTGSAAMTVLPGPKPSCAAVIWRVPTSRLHTPTRVKALSLKWYDSFPGSSSLSRTLPQQRAGTVGCFLSGHHSQISTGEKTTLLFLFISRAREHYPVRSRTSTHWHTGCRHTHYCYVIVKKN